MGIGSVEPRKFSSFQLVWKWYILVLFRCKMCVTAGSKADGRRSKFLVRETRTRNLAQEICIQVALRTIQISRMRNMADDRDDKEFHNFFSG